MKRVWKILVLYIVILFLLTGCWSRKELNEIGIVTALGIDKSEEGYIISVQIINPGEIAGKTSTGRTEVVRFMGKAETVFEALRELTTDVPRKLYLAHLREVVIGETLAKEGIGKILDFLSRDHEIRTDFYLTIAKGSPAYEILNVQTALEKIPANKLFSALENSEENWARTKTVKLDELISSIVSKGKEPVITGIYMYGDQDSAGDFADVQKVSPSNGLRINQIGVFKKDKLLGWLSEEESKGFNYITDNVKSTVVNVPCDNGKVSVETVRSKTSVKGKIENGKPKINIIITSEGNIGEVQCEIDLSKQESLKKLEEEYQNNIKAKVEDSIITVQEEYQSDIFGFGDVIHRSDPKAWKRYENNWDEEFSNLEFTIKVEGKIRRLGTITDSFQEEIRE